MSRRVNKPDTQADIEVRECLAKKISFIMVAGAGSGKTTSLIKALKYIDDTEGKKLRQQGKRIACITYTTTAEGEILDDVGHDSLFHVSTIHSFLWELIRPFQPNIKAWVISKIENKINDLIEAKRNFSSRVQQRTRDKNEADTLRYQEIAEKINSVNEFQYETGSNYVDGILGHSDIIKMVPELIKTSTLLQSILAEKYPYFFIDESQDTVLPFINTMKVVDKNIKNFCLGFFGDPMQKIYMTGAGAIDIEPGWRQINKPENFRCSTDVLTIVNEIRKGVDSLEQTGGRKIKVNQDLHAVKGSATLFLLSADENRDEKIKSVRKYLASVNTDPLWLLDTKEANIKILVIEHRMAAKRLEFQDLFSAFNDNPNESIASSFKEGTHWSLQPFSKFAIPLIQAFKNNNQFEVIEMLRRSCPLLQKGAIKTSDKQPRELLSQLKNAVNELSYKFDSDCTLVRDVLTYMRDEQLFALEERITKRLDGEDTVSVEDNDENRSIDSVLENYFNVPVKQLLGYQKYINEESAYSTQHSIKGAEFERVLVVLDDEEGNSNFYSYDKLFGIAPLSEKDQENIETGTDNTLARTRRLFYVCCSRALTDLAVILFVADPDASKEAIKSSRIFPLVSIKNDIDLLLK